MFNRHLIIPLIACGIIGIPALMYESDLFQKRDEEAVQPDPYGWMAPVASPPVSSNVILRPGQAVTATAPIQTPGLQPATNEVPDVIGRDSIVWSQAYGTTIGLPAASQPGFENVQNANSATSSLSGLAAPVAASPYSFATSQPVSSTIPPVLPAGVSGSSAAHPYLPSASSNPMPGTNQPMAFRPVFSFHEILNWKITPDDVRSRFDRVSVVETDYGLVGLRVPLVTGVNRFDLHGSLTWFFDDNDKLQRMAFRGWTGDATVLTDFLQTQFGLMPQDQGKKRLHVARRGRSLTAAATFRFAPVLDSAKSNEQIVVAFEINNPSGGYILSQEFASGLPELR